MPGKPMMASGNADPRRLALEVLLDVFVRELTLTAALSRATDRPRAPRDLSLAKALCFGVLRWHPRLAAVLNQLLDRPLKQRDRDVQIILLLGLYQLLYMRVPAHAAVNETVALVTRRGKPWAKGLVNGVLRRLQRERDALCLKVDTDEAAALAHPSWLMGSIRRCWPQDWRSILMQNNRHPPMSLRVNQLRISREAYVARLARSGLEAYPSSYARTGIALAEPRDVATLPGFSDGLVSVQDVSAQLAAPLLAPTPGERVLDACAAPGGKTAHLLEHQPELGELVALDRDAERLALVRDNLARLGLEARTVCADAARPADWWDGRPYHRILLDAPCSASGVIRRHPDIKLLRKAEQMPDLATRQERLLKALWPLLAPGGTLLYATCSVLCEENEAQIARFVASEDGVEVQPIDTAWGRPLRFGQQVLPGDEDMDGFYYALLRKR